MIDRLKNLVWLAVVVFSVCAFIQKMMDVTPKVEAVEQRVTDHDVRIADCEKRTVVVESRVSGVEMKLDMVLANQTEQGKDIKDIYHLIMERHR